MKASRPPGRGFLWQGALILLPVFVLAAAGFLSLRQDQLLARHEAEQTAQTAAEQLAQAWWTRLFERSSTEQFKDHTFLLDAQGHLLSPPPAPGLPLPRALDPGQVDDAQRQWWPAVSAHPTNAMGRAAALAAGREFLALNPPADFAARVQFQMAQWSADEGQLDEAVRQFRVVADRFPDSLSESGLPLGPLAQFKALEILARGEQKLSPADATWLSGLCSNLVRHPSFLTANLLVRLANLPGVPGGEGLLPPSSRHPRDLTVAKFTPQGRLIEQSVPPPKIWGSTNLVDPWLDEWSRLEAQRDLAGNALEQLPSREGTPLLLLNTNLAPRAPPVPPIFWFHAPDLSLNPQPIFLNGYLIPRAGHSRARGSFTRNILERTAISGEATSFTPDGRRARVWILDGSAAAWKPEVEWLAARIANPDGTYSVVCRALGQWVAADRTGKIGSRVFDDLKANLPELPPWLDYSLEVAGTSLVSSNNLRTLALTGVGKGGGQVWSSSAPLTPPEVIASAARLEHGVEYLRVRMHFVSPDMFYARQKTRTLLFGGLIGLATLAAWVGFFSTRRALLRQEQLNELKSSFVSSVSHELRAPLASMRLLAESLERGKVAEPERQAGYFRFLVQECRRLSSLVENVLNFARIEQGRKQYEFEPTDPAALLRHTFQLMEPAAAEKQVTLVLDLPETELARLAAPPLLDGQAVQQALINLLDNALKHSPPSQTVTLGLSVAPTPVGDGVTPATGPASIPAGLRLWVRDCGPGIPSEDHQRIFERFYRRGSELRRETQGVGIGLTIVKHIAEAHGGSVRVDSAPGRGSTFAIELPLPGSAPGAQPCAS
jgi:two-component system phosphate regulon sensor histidine kinase PhoR